MTRVRTQLQMQLLIEAAQLRIEVSRVPKGKAKDALFQHINALEQAAIIEGWINAPGFDVWRK